MGMEMERERERFSGMREFLGVGVVICIFFIQAAF